MQEWHPTKNGELTPQGVMPNSMKKVWWLLPYDDPKTGKHFNFEWKTAVSNRTRGLGCPYLTGHAVWIGFNDLATINPKLASEWHPDKNGDLTPKDVTSSSQKEVWWLLPYDDPKTGKHFDFEWKASVATRSNGRGCPYLSGNAIWLGFNDLQTTYPAIADEWNFDRNKDKKPEMYSESSTKRVWWKCKKGHEWQAVIESRTKNNSKCPYCSGLKAIEGETDLKTIFPEIAEDWNYEKNRNQRPENYKPNAHKKMWWKCIRCGAEWRSRIDARTSGMSNCPNC